MNMEPSSSSSVCTDPGAMRRRLVEDLGIERTYSFEDGSDYSRTAPRVRFADGELRYEYPDCAREFCALPALLGNEQMAAEVAFIRQRVYGDLSYLPLPCAHHRMFGNLNLTRVRMPYPVFRAYQDFHVLDVAVLWTYQEGTWLDVEVVPGRITRETLQKVYLRECYLEFIPYRLDDIGPNDNFAMFMRDMLEEDAEESAEVWTDCCFCLKPESEKEFRRKKFEAKRSEKDDQRDARYWRAKYEKLLDDKRRYGRMKKYRDLSDDTKPEGAADWAPMVSRIWDEPKPPPAKSTWQDLIWTAMWSALRVVGICITRMCMLTGPIGVTWMAFHFRDHFDGTKRSDAEMKEKADEARMRREEMDRKKKEQREQDEKTGRNNAFVGAAQAKVEEPDYTNMLSAFAGSMVILSTANTWRQVATQLAGIAMFKFGKKEVDYIGDMFEKYVTEGIREFEILSGRDPDEPKPEGPFGDLSLKLKELRANSITLAETPIGKALKASMTLFAYTYYGEKDGKVDISETSLEKLFSYCDFNQKATPKSLMDSFFDVSEFVLSFADLVRHNPKGLGLFIFPHTLSQRFAHIKEHLVEFENGNLSHKFALDPAEFYNDAVSLEVDLKIMLQKFNRKEVVAAPTMVALYTQYYRHVQEYIVRMQKSKIFHSFRRRCICVVFTGNSGVGKSTLSKQLMHLLGEACDFPHDQKHIWNARDGKWDDGLRPGATIYDFDDVCNGKIGNQELGEQLMARIVKFVNNAVCISSQAEASDKGAIAYEPELIVITSNVRNLNAGQYTNDLESFFSRLMMFEVTVKEEFQEKGSGKIDQSRATIRDPVHKLQEYRCTPTIIKAPENPRTANQKSRTGIKDENIGDSLTTEQFMRMMILRFERNRMRQKKLVSDYEELRTTAVCSGCRLYPNWCRCAKKDYIDVELARENFTEEEAKEFKAAHCGKPKESDDEDMKPEAFLQALSAVPGALLLDIVARLSTISFPRLRSRIGSLIANAFVGTIAAACRGFYHAEPHEQASALIALGMFTGCGVMPTYRMYQHDPNTALLCVSGFVAGSCWVMCHIKDLAARATVILMEENIKCGVTPLTVSLRVLMLGIAMRGAAQVCANLTNIPEEMRPEALMPDTTEQARKKIAAPDFWELPVIQREPKGTMTDDQAWNVISRHFVMIGNRCLGFALTGNLFIVPRHMKTPAVKVQVSKMPVTKTNSSYGILYDRYDFPDKDFAIVRYSNTVNLESGLQYLPVKFVEATCGKFMQFRANRWNSVPTALSPGFVSNGTESECGSKFADMGYKHKVFTENGDCMSPILSASAPFGKILAFHMGGSKIYGVANGSAYTLTQQDVFSALEAMDIVVPECVVYDETAMEGFPLKQVVPEVHERAVTNFVLVDTDDVARVKLLGGIPTASVKPKSALVPSILAPHILGRENIHGPPKFRKNRNYAEYFHKALQGLQPIDHCALDFAIHDYLLPLTEHADLLPWRGSNVLSFDQAVNGIPGNRFVSSINLNTAGGPGYGKKVHHFEVVGDRKIAHPGIEEATMTLLDGYRNGVLIIPRFSTGLKDEATLTFEYAGKDKVRIFFVAPTHFLLVGKMLFAKIHTYLMAFPQFSELMGSLNHCTEEWSDLVKYATRYPYLFDGDYSKYDTRQTQQTFDAAKEVFVKLAEALGYSEEDRVAICMYVDAMCYANLEYNGVLLQFAMWMKSGVWITLLLNGVTNALLVRVVYFNLGFRKYFRDHVALAIQGDDMCGSTKLYGFNMLAMSREFLRIGMPFTSASKTDQFKGFLELEEMSFCSRRFVFDEFLSEWDAPLEMSSIWKSLFWHNASGDLSSLETVMGDAWTKLIEFSRHGRDIFEEESERMFGAFESAGVPRSALPCPVLTYDGVMRWRIDNHYMKPEAAQLCESEHIGTYIPQKHNRALSGGYHTRQRGDPLKALTSTAILNFGRRPSSPRPAPNIKFRMTTQKDFSRQTRPEEENRVVHNVNYNDEEVGWAAGGYSQWERTQDISRDRHTNDSILERPVQIAQYEWTPGAGFNFRFDPWRQVCEDTAVVNRLALHFLMKADLHLTFLINGGPFYYGRLMCAYNYMNGEDNYTLASATDAVSLMQLSQLPHVLLDPRANEGGSLLCPFIFRNHSLEIPSNEWRQLGELHLQELTPLQHANGSADPVTVTIIGRLVNVHLSVPTSKLPSTIAPQAGEYGMISGPLQNAADFAGTMSEVPYIGPYAKATQMVTSVGAKVAKMFGYSSPRAEAIMNNVQQPNLAVTDEQFLGTSLAITGKREVTIDPRVVGAPPVDELAIASLARRWSWFAQFDWSTSTGPGDGLFFCDVTPLLGAVLNISQVPGEAQTRIQLAPMGFAALPFGVWTGDIEFKFQIVCSAHHRGRLRFTHDPHTLPEGIGVTMNRNETSIVDISATTEYIMKVGWSQATNYLRVKSESDSLGTILPGYSSIVRPRNVNANGQIGVTVITGLTSPAEEEQTISINVFCRAGENFLVHDPTHDNLFGFKLGTQILPAAGNPPIQSFIPATEVQDPDPVLVEYTGDPRGFFDDFDSANGLDSLPNVGVNNTPALVLRTGSNGFAVMSRAAVGEQQSFQLRLRATASGTSTLTWDDLVLGNGHQETFSGIGDTKTITVTLPQGGRESVVFWYFTLVSGARMAIEQLTTKIPDNLQLNAITAAQLNAVYPGTLVSGEFVFADDQSLSLADYASDTGVNYESLNDGTYQVLSGTNGVNPPWVIPAGTSVSTLYYFSTTSTPQSDELEKEGDEGNPESDHIDQAIHETPLFNPTDVFFGEPCLSFRPLLKRFEGQYFLEATAAARRFSFGLPHFPLATLSATIPEASLTTRGIAVTSLYHYLRSAFVTERGSMRIKLLYAGDPGARFVHTVLRRERVNKNLSTLQVPTTVASGFRWGGTGYSFSPLTGEASFEMPWYNLRRFFPARLKTETVAQYDMPSYQLTVGMQNGGTVDVCYATGEDYQLSIFTHVPAFDLT